MLERRSLLASQKQNRANRGKKQTCELAVAKFAARVSERSAAKRNTSARKALPLFQHLALHLMQIIVSHFTHLHLNNFPKVIPSRLCRLSRLSLSLSFLQHAEGNKNFRCQLLLLWRAAYIQISVALQKLRKLPVCSGFFVFVGMRRSFKVDSNLDRRRLETLSCSTQIMKEVK